MTSPPQPTRLPWDLEFTADAPELAVSWRYDAPRAWLHVTVRNEGAETLRPAEVQLAAELELAAADGWAWLHGRYMQMDALVRRFGTPPDEGYDGRYVRASDEARTYISREVAVLTLPSETTPSLLIGSLRMDRFFFDVELEVDAEEEYVEQVRLTWDLRGAEIAPGEEIELPPVLLLDGRDPQALIERYADEAAREMEARVPDHVPTGWCSWYYFYGSVSEADVLANLAAMREENHPAEYVQVDDGYQSHTGDWLVPNGKFPSGMKALADRIREAGYRPGLWLAPFVLNEDSQGLRDRPEMALKTHDGEVVFVQTWLGRCAVLDCTHPASEAWLREVFGTVVRDWGYEYLKLDALSYAARPGDEVRYHTPGTTAPANLRRGLEIIREAAGDETFILGCTCHFGPAVGVVDAMRVGPDVKELWADGANPSVRHAMQLTLQRNWMHNRWWVNDPDCLLVRDTDTALNLAETRFLATGIALSGGMVVASDDLPKLPDKRLAMAMALIPPPGVAARPLDPGDGPVPSTWRVDLGDGRFLAGILNWDDIPRWVVVNELLQAGEIAFDVWNGKLLGKGDVLLAPHEGALWQVTAPGSTPRVVGDTGHLNYTRLYQRPVSGRIQVRNDDARPRTIAIEVRGRAFEVDLPPGVARWFD
ncbi:MAG: glycoside hydrolase family 36 protein [Dehalococcoidia bacterium]